ncbi:MAG: PQQ-like beta-propeller repeat protein [Nocardiopsaceae bacterium]|nr:PQQ-like beta-propeller repeat protein [Nocardiopsaceae bacterium]
MIATVPLSHGTSYAIAAYSASTGGTRWTKLAPPDTSGHPSGPVINPSGDTIYIGGNRTTAYAVADGSVRWTTAYNRNFPGWGQLSGIIGLSGDGTRLVATRQTKRGITWSITIVAYKT